MRISLSHGKNWKNGCSMTSMASASPPPSRAEGSFMRRRNRMSPASGLRFCGTLTFSYIRNNNNNTNLPSHILKKTPCNRSPRNVSTRTVLALQGSCSCTLFMWFATQFQTSPNSSSSGDNRLPQKEGKQIGGGYFDTAV